MKSTLSDRTNFNPTPHIPNHRKRSSQPDLTQHTNHEQIELQWPIGHRVLVSTETGLRTQAANQLQEMEVEHVRQVEKLRERLAEGLQYFKWGQHTEALAAFEAALEIDPHSKANLFVDKIHRMGREMFG